MEKHIRLVLALAVVVAIAGVHMMATMKLGYEAAAPLLSEGPGLSVSSADSGAALSVSVSQSAKLNQEAGTSVSQESGSAGSTTAYQASVQTSGVPSSSVQSAPSAETKKSSHVVSNAISGFDYAVPSPSLDTSVKLVN